MALHDEVQRFVDTNRRYQFVLAASLNNRIVIANAHCKIIFLDNKTNVDVFLTDPSEKCKFHVTSVIEFLDREIDLDKHANLTLQKYFTLIQQCLSGVFLNGQLDWLGILNRENYKTQLRQFVMKDFPIGHDLIYLLNSGHKWVQHVEEYMQKNGIKLL